MGEALWYGNIILQAVLLVRLSQLGLLRRYALLASYLAFDAVTSAVMVYLRQSGTAGGNAYGWSYLLKRPVVWAFYFLLLLELYSIILEEFPGLRRLGRLVSVSALAAVAAVGCALIVIDGRRGMDPFPLLAALVLQGRSVLLCLSVASFFLLLFVAHFHLSVRRNVWVLYASWSGFFVCSAVVMSLREHFGRPFVPLQNLSNYVLTILALLGPTLLLSRRGEEAFQPLRLPGVGQNRETETALLLQLQNFNQTLVRTLRQ